MFLRQPVTIEKLTDLLRRTVDEPLGSGRCRPPIGDGKYDLHAEIPVILDRVCVWLVP